MAFNFDNKSYDDVAVTCSSMSADSSYVERLAITQPSSAFQLSMSFWFFTIVLPFLSDFIIFGLLTLSSVMPSKLLARMICSSSNFQTTQFLLQRRRADASHLEIVFVAHNDNCWKHLVVFFSNHTRYESTHELLDELTARTTRV